MNTQDASEKFVSHEVLMDASPSRVWTVLTNPELMKLWVSDTEVEINSDWKVGRPFIIKAYMSKYTHENKGTILALEPEKLFRYNYWTKISRLPDKPENYSIVEFRLNHEGSQTRLTVTQTNFLAKASFEHADFYWRNTVTVIKRVAEDTQGR